MKTIVDYFKHIFSHQWIETEHEGPFIAYKCDKCKRSMIYNMENCSTHITNNGN